MGFLIWAVICVFVLALIIIGFALLQSTSSRCPSPSHRHARLTFTVVSTILGLGALLSPLYYEFPAGNGVLYSIKENGTLVEHPWGTFERGKWLVWLPAKNKELGKVYATVSPITENPKVQRLGYTGRVYLFDPKRFLADPRNQNQEFWGITNSFVFDHIESAAAKALKFCQYEFNYARSKELAAFYNPADDRQQERFRTLVKAALNECIGERGLWVEVSNFSLS
jgi:hypothetical protein